MSFNPPPLPPTQPTWGQFQIWWQAMLSSLGTELGALEAAQDALAAAVAAQADATAALADAAAAQTTATTAQTTATTAQTAADDVKKTDKISGSWTSPGEVLTATDAGTDATVTVAAHTRKWGDNSSTSVNAHTFTALAYSTAYYVYYDDPTQNDATPSYQISTNANTAAANSASNRIYVGKVVTPAALGAPTKGGTTPPGGGYGGPADIP